MTQNQIAYQRLLEEQRAHKVEEQREQDLALSKIELNETQISQMLAAIEKLREEAREAGYSADQAQIDLIERQIMEGNYGMQEIYGIWNLVDRMGSTLQKYASLFFPILNLFGGNSSSSKSGSYSVSKTSSDKDGNKTTYTYKEAPKRRSSTLFDL